MNIKEMIVNKKVTFVRYQNKELWYVTECGFEFPVPIEDTGTGIFLPSDKAMMFMRWIRKHIEMLDKAKTDSLVTKNPAADASAPLGTSDDINEVKVTWKP